jgi:hypothetical protein
MWAELSEAMKVAQAALDMCTVPANLWKRLRALSGALGTVADLEFDLTGSADFAGDAISQLGLDETGVVCMVCGGAPSVVIQYPWVDLDPEGLARGTACSACAEANGVEALYWLPRAPPPAADVAEPDVGSLEAVRCYIDAHELPPSSPPPRPASASLERLYAVDSHADIHPGHTAWVATVPFWAGRQILDAMYVSDKTMSIFTVKRVIANDDEVLSDLPPRSSPIVLARKVMQLGAKIEVLVENGSDAPARFMATVMVTLLDEDGQREEQVPVYGGAPFRGEGA